MEDRSILVVQMIYTPNFYIDILGVKIESPTSGKIRLFAKNKMVIESYNIEDSDNNMKIVRTTTYFFNMFFFLNFLANNNMIDKDGKVLKDSFNMGEDDSPSLA